MKFDLKLITNVSKAVLKDKLGRVVVNPLNELLDDNITDVVTSIGSFVIRSVRGTFTRSITFSIGTKYNDIWMEDALYGILYKYNDIKRESNLELVNSGENDGSGMYYRLAPGTHSLKYRDYNILLVIQSSSSQPTNGRELIYRTYTVITYDLSPEFITNFEKDMIRHRNFIMSIKTDAPVIYVYKDHHEGDGFTYWEKSVPINKRPIGSIYLPRDMKKLLIDTVNRFFSSKKIYKKHGVPHNLKILLHSKFGGTGKDSITRMLASEYNRNIYYVTGGKNGKFVPDAISDNSDNVINPLFLISDIDKYPFIISDVDIDMESVDGSKEDRLVNKQMFGKMINALDGLMTGEDRIIIMTTNHIEKFSPIFLRPGRVDLILETPTVGVEVFRKYTYDNFDKVLPKDIKLKSSTLSVADLQFDILYLKLNFDEFVEKHVESK